MTVKYYVGVRHQEDATIVSTHRVIVLLAQHLDRGTLPLLWRASSRTHSEDDSLKMFSESPNLLGWPVSSGLRPAGHQARPPCGSPSHGLFILLLLKRVTSSRGHTLSSSMTIVVSRVGVLVFKEVHKTASPILPDETIAPEQ